MKKILFIMDPIEKINYEKDTSLHLIRGAFANHLDVFFCKMEDLELIQDRCHTNCSKIIFDNNNKLEKLDHSLRDLSDFSYVFIRTDPPFDRAYNYGTLFLDYVEASTKIINKPQALRDCNEKLTSLFYANFTVDTLVSSKAESIASFISRYPRVTLKPIDGFAGRGILFTDSQDPQQLEKVKEVSHNFKHKIIVQKYIVEAKDGDKRVLLWNGKVLGAILRLHPEGKEINNLDAGGTAIATTLTPKQSEISEFLAQDLLKRGIYFSGIDFLGDYLIEVNVTSPTGLVQLCKFEKRDFHIEIIKDLLNI